MSYKRRQARQAAVMDAGDTFYVAPLGNPQAVSTEWDLDMPQSITGSPREERSDQMNNFAYPIAVASDPDAHDYVDWAVGGVPGYVKSVGSVGVTDSKNVDRHDFQGQMAVIRRMPDTNYGPVKTSDHNSILGMLYAMQETNHFFPNEVSQADVIRAV